jgi:hypothetical protein
VISTATQSVRKHDNKDGRIRVVKQFCVYDAELFVKALRFKAALNYAFWCARNSDTATFPDSLFDL